MRPTGGDSDEPFGYPTKRGSTSRRLEDAREGARRFPTGLIDNASGPLGDFWSTAISGCARAWPGLALTHIITRGLSPFILSCGQLPPARLHISVTCARHRHVCPPVQINEHDRTVHPHNHLIEKVDMLEV